MASKIVKEAEFLSQFSKKLNDLFYEFHDGIHEEWPGCSNQMFCDILDEIETRRDDIILQVSLTHDIQDTE